MCFKLLQTIGVWWYDKGGLSDLTKGRGKVSWPIVVLKRCGVTLAMLDLARFGEVEQ